MPLVRIHLPGVSFYAVGSKPPEAIKALAADDVIVVGYVDDLQSFLDKMRISVAPLRYGAGIKGKVGTAMAAGLPVIATSVATEGMDITSGREIISVDGPQAFADAVVMLYKNQEQWNQISVNGIEFAEKTWGAKAAWSNFSQILLSLGLEVNKSPIRLQLYK